MKPILSFIILALSFTIQISFSQENIQYCGYIPSTISFNSEILNLQSETCSLGRVSVPVALTFLMKSDSTSSYYEGLENEIMDSLTLAFSMVGIHPYLCADPVFIFSDEVYDYAIGDEDETILWPGLKNNRINVVIPNTLSSGSGAQYCGIAGIFPNTVFTRYSCISSRTISHEIGHLFSLLHTHDRSTGIELVNGSNCTTAGDRICDTPADPYRLDLVDRDCTWRGTYEDELGNDIDFLDPNGDKYQTDVTNLMSYYGALGCRNSFTLQQGEVMHNSLESKILNYGYETINLLFEIYEQEEICDVGYSVSVRIKNPLPDVSYLWDMEADGITDHIAPDIQHLYTENGTYTIELSMEYPNGKTYFYSNQCAINFENHSITAPFIDDFESDSLRPHVRLLESTPYRWRLGLRLAGSERRSVAQDQIHYNESSIMEYRINVDNLDNPVLEFDYSSNTDQLVGGDSLLVELLSCGNNTLTLFERAGADLGTGGNERHENIPLPPLNAEIITIRFTTIGDGSNYHELYIDNLKIIEESPTRSSELDSRKLLVFPNPSSNLVNIESIANVVRIDLIDKYGRTRATRYQSKQMDLSMLEAGVYFMRVQIGDEFYNRKVVKTD